MRTKNIVKKQCGRLFRNEWIKITFSCLILFGVSLGKNGFTQESVEEKLTILSQKVSRLNRLGEYEEAIGVARQSLELASDHFGNDHAETANWLNILAYFCRLQGKYEEAEPLYERALGIFEKQLGGDDPETANSLNNLAGLYKLQGKYEEAEPLFRRVLAICEKQFGAENLDVIPMISALAELYELQGRFGEVEQLYKRVHAILEEELGPEDINTAASLNNLAETYRKQGKYEEAEPLYEQVLAICEEQLGPKHSNTAALLNNIALLYKSQGKYEEAEPMYKRTLAINEEQLGADHPETAKSLNNLAGLYKSQGNYEEAIPLCERALAIYEEQLGTGHPMTANSLNNLASLYKSHGNYEKAESMFKRSLVIFEEQLGVDHPNAASALNNLAGLYELRSNYEAAEPLYVRALAILEEKLGADHPETATALINLALLNESQGKFKEAELYGTRLLQGNHRYYVRMLGYFPDRDCLAIQNNLLTTLAVGNLLNGKLAAQEQIWFKGSVLEAMNHRRALEEGLCNSEAGRKLLSERENLSLQYRRAVLETGANSEGSNILQKRLAELEKSIASLLKEDLLLAVGAVDVAAVGMALPTGSVLVESFRYDHRLAERGWEDRYASVVIQHEGEPVYVPNGKAEEMEDAIAVYRNAVSNEAKKNYDSGLRQAEANLWEAYLAPLETLLKPGQSVIFSLDSQLHFIPVGMIRDADGVPFGQKYKVRYVTSGRDLVKEVKRKGDGKKSALVLGNPAYRDNQPLRALAEAEEEIEAKLVASNLRAGIQDDAGSITLTPLPGTAREIASLRDRLEKSGYAVTSLSHEEATEEALKQAIDGHDIVHLATHGFFLSEIERDTNPQDGFLSPGGSDQQTPIVISDPMYRSGLALAGAQSTFNLWKEGKVPPPSKDGILLAAEANLLNLHGTDLVVLSACETASGEALDGEGVMGLRRAFASAGANNTIMTLWPVNDEATVEVMDAFYEKYLSGTHPAIALAEVQNELYEPFVEKYGEVEAIARLAPFVCMSLGKVE